MMQLVYGGSYEDKTRYFFEQSIYVSMSIWILCTFTFVILAEFQ